MLEDPLLLICYLHLPSQFQKFTSQTDKGRLRGTLLGNQPSSNKEPKHATHTTHGNSKLEGCVSRRTLFKKTLPHLFSFPFVYILILFFFTSFDLRSRCPSKESAVLPIKTELGLATWPLDTSASWPCLVSGFASSRRKTFPPGPTNRDGGKSNVSPSQVSSPEVWRQWLKNKH